MKKNCFKIKIISRLLLLLCAVFMIGVMIPLTVSADGELPDRHSAGRSQDEQTEWDQGSRGNTTETIKAATTHTSKPATTAAGEQPDAGTNPKTGGGFYVTALWLTLCGSTALVAGLSAKRQRQQRANH